MFNRKVVIVGAGLGGLYTANRLIKIGVFPNNITLIDPRAGCYTRPGHLNPKIFSIVHKLTGIAIDGVSSAHHIKELERIMYNNLLALDVCFVNEFFVDLFYKGNWGVITDSGKWFLADFIFDCTAKAAKVAESINRLHMASRLSPVFKSSSLVTINPIKNQVIAHVLIPQYKNLNNFVFYGVAIPKFVTVLPLQQQIEIREKLQNLGWNFEAFPTFSFMPQPEKNKVCLYMEAPPNLTKYQQKAWIKLLLTIYSKGTVNDFAELKDSYKYKGKKHRISGFKNEPYILNKVVFQANKFPTVFLCFDALKGFDYRLGMGVYSGIECLEMILRHIGIFNGNIIGVDAISIENEIFKYLFADYQHDLIEFLNSRQLAINHGYKYFNKIYSKAAEQEQDPIQKQRYLLIAAQLGKPPSSSSSHAPKINFFMENSKLVDKNLHMNSQLALHSQSLVENGKFSLPRLLVQYEAKNSKLSVLIILLEWLQVWIGARANVSIRKNLGVSEITLLTKTPSLFFNQVIFQLRERGRPSFFITNDKNQSDLDSRNVIFSHS